jgi:hypothetical protein
MLTPRPETSEIWSLVEILAGKWLQTLAVIQTVCRFKVDQAQLLCAEWHWSRPAIVGNFDWRDRQSVMRSSEPRSSVGCLPSLFGLSTRSTALRTR